MTEHKETLVNPLARARGLGSTHHGFSHWINERVSAVVALPLMLWLVWSVVNMDHSYEGFTAWLHAPVNAVLMILSVLSVFYHTAMGLQVVVEDYVHHEGLKLCKLYGIKLLFLAMTIACVFSILKIAFSG